ncbi:MAG TPA: MarR family transcriptional regulator [Pseudolysinimonas sp.]|nr:MarR family transcriptional regulator [Pseudolysinimonas sp.]
MSRTPGTEQPSTDAERLALVAGRLNRRLQAATGGLSHGLLSALAVVAKRGPLRLSDLAQLEGVSAPSMTRTIAELEARGYVVRRPDPVDGRAALIAAADAGTAAIIDARSTRAQVVADLLGALDENDAAAISAALPALERLTEPQQTPSATSAS